MKKIAAFLALSLIFATACKNDQSENPMPTYTPPVAEKKETVLEKHGDIRIDNYYWMNERDHPEVIDYLERENDYFDKMTAHTQGLQTLLFDEIKSRIKEDDQSVPYKKNGYWYMTRYEVGKDYPIYTRKKGSQEAEEEILFNVNELAVGHNYYQLGGLNVSPDNRMVAFGVDTVSRRKYTIQIKNLETGDLYPEKIETTTGGSVWANDNKTLFYTRKDEVTLRSNKIYKHILGTDPATDALVYEETDETFSTYIYKTKSEKYLVIGSQSTLTSEFRILEADKPGGNFRIFQPRERGLEYSFSHYKDHFYVLTNKDGATNFKLMKTPIAKTNKGHWEDVIPHREDVLLEDVDIFKDFLVLNERNNGLNKIRIIRWDGKEDYYLPFDIETYTAGSNVNVEFDTDWYRYSYTSLATPTSTVEFNMNTRETRVLKEQEVLGGTFDKNNYEEKRVWATAADGTKIPISMVYKKGMVQDGKNPLLIYGYGSYGSTIDPTFSISRLSLLDRGFIYAIAHVRGGEYLGRSWYENGKLLHKKNTFSDFVDASKFLIAEKYTSPEHLYAQGGSAGGLLMGAVLNLAPEIYKGVIAEVPFVDVVTTMLDDSIPLTTSEYDEWGNPNDSVYYQYMKSYSPYDQVEAKAYPNIMVTTGYHDSQVQYWEPAKWVAKLREFKTDTNKLLFHTNMEAGHSGSSARFESIKETAREYAFFLDLENIKQ
nr:S9 family peptidase [Bacteroidota bacterium]